MTASTRVRTSELLRAFARSAPERVDLGSISEALEDRSFGILVLCLALPNGVPGPYLPGFSTVLALPIIWLGVQLALGRARPRLPGFLRRLSFRRQRFVGFVERASPLIRRIERWLHPRPSWMTADGGHRSLGYVLMIFGFVLAMPVPFGNVPIAIAISVLALGLVEEDSRALVCGLIIGVFGCLWQVALLTVGIEAIDRLSPYL